jgi:predicted RecB family nuclease
MSVRTSNWVSKTDLLRYLRCPYAFYLVDSGQIAFEATINEQQVRRIEEGVQFQVGVEAPVPRLAIEPVELPRIFAEESIRLFGVPLFENPRLEIYGMPDAIDTEQGALFPVEVKSHKDVQSSDELELAFYWMLLEPFRTKNVRPRGHLLLRRHDAVEEVQVEIAPRRFERVHELLSEIRSARRNGVQPRVCRCTVCSGLMQGEIHNTTQANKDLTMIFGIGRAYATHLERTGIGNYEALAAADSVTIVEDLRRKQCFVSTAIVESWKHHAKSYHIAQPVVFGDLPALGFYLALDLEYLHFLSETKVTPHG